MPRHADYALVVAVALAAYLNNLGNGFVYDDRYVVELNPVVQNLDWKGLVTSSYWGEIVDAGLYRPLTLLSFGLNRLVSGSAAGFHLVNDALHAAVAGLVLLVARTLGLGRFPSFAAALLFAIHPVQTEAVNSMVGRAEILTLGFVLLALLSTLKGRSALVTGALFFLALCSKESAAFALPLFVLLPFFSERKLSPTTLAALAGALGAYALLRVSVLGSFGISGREIGFLDNPVATAGWGARLLTAPALLARYIRMTLWPATLSADYSFEQIPLPGSPLDLRVLFGLALAAGLVTLAWKKRDLTGFAATAFLLPIAGFLHLLFPLGTLFAERLLYLPMFGAALLFGLALAQLGPRTGSVVLTLVAVASFARVMDRNGDWRDNEILFRRTVETSPASARSHFLLGAELMEKKEFVEAALWFERGLQIYPEHLGARMSSGQAHLASGDAEKAADAFEEALALAPEAREVEDAFVEASLEAGRQRAREGEFALAAERFRSVLELDAENAVALNYLGLIAERRGDLDEAVRLYEEALTADPELELPLVNLASIHMGRGALSEAERLYSRAIRLAPDSYEAYNGLGICLARQGRVEEAEAAFRRAIEIAPDLPAARDNLRLIGREP